MCLLEKLHPQLAMWIEKQTIWAVGFGATLRRPEILLWYVNDCVICWGGAWTNKNKDVNTEMWEAAKVFFLRADWFWRHIISCKNYILVGVTKIRLIDMYIFIRIYVHMHIYEDTVPPKRIEICFQDDSSMIPDIFSSFQLFSNFLDLPFICLSTYIYICIDIAPFNKSR